MGRLEYIVPGKSVRAGDVMVSYLSARTPRVLRISRPRYMSMHNRLVAALQSNFDQSGLCPAGHVTEVPKPKDRTSNCRKWYHLVEVPLRSGVSETEAFAVGELVIRDVFLDLSLAAVRGHSGPKHDRQPHRVYAPSRSAGAIGIPA